MISAMKNDFIVSGYSSVNYILRVHNLPKVGVTELVQNRDNSTPYYGGNGLNVAFYLAKLGLRAMLIMRGGLDYDTQGYPDFFRDNGIITDAITSVDEAATPVCYLVEDDRNDHMTFFYTGSMDGRYAPARYPDAYFENASYAIMTVASNPDNRAFLEGVKKFGLPLAFVMRADPNAFPPEFLNEVLHEASIVFMNEIEQEYIGQVLGFDPVAELLRHGRTRTVVVTHGGAGCIVYELENEAVKATAVAATRPDVVVDTTGAGDSFVSGFLYGLVKGHDSITCAHYGATVSSFIIEATGCLTRVPTEAEMLCRLKERRKDV